MAVEHPRTGWEGGGARWFRRTQLYTAVFDEDVDLDNYIVAGAPYAGAIGGWMAARPFGRLPAAMAR
jgi:hypothetical protein